MCSKGHIDWGVLPHPNPIPEQACLPVAFPLRWEGSGKDFN